MLFSNDCTASIIYSKCLHRAYPHPFISSLMTQEDFIYLCEHLNEINLSLAEPFSIPIPNEHNRPETYGLSIDGGKLKPLFPHCNDKQTTLDNYIKRLQRFYDSPYHTNEENLFIMNHKDPSVIKYGENFTFRRKYMDRFLNSPIPNKMLITEIKEYAPFQSETITIDVKKHNQLKQTFNYTTSCLFPKYINTFSKFA